MTKMLKINGRFINKIVSFDNELYAEEQELTTVDGTLVTDIAFKKQKFTVGYRFLTDEEMTFIINAVKGKSFLADFFDKETMKTITGTFYLSPPNNLTKGAGYDINKRIWDRLTFTAVETTARG